MSDDETPNEAPGPGEFAAQLIRQLYSDLDGVLFAGEQPIAAAHEFAAACAESGQPRGAALYLLLRSALAAHAALVGEAEDEWQFPEDAVVAATLAELFPRAASQVAALARHAARLSRYSAEVEPAGSPLSKALASAIRRLYAGLMEEDAALSTGGLIELRAMLVHADAVASLIDPSNADDRPIRVFSPHRFHDHFLKLTEAVQAAASTSTDRPVATLSLDGRITALITEAGHPLEAAVDTIRAGIPGDPTTREHALLRMQGLLQQIESLRRRPVAPFEELARGELSYLSLVTAAATAPMAAPGRFDFQQLAQVASYNRILLRGSRPSPAASH